MTYTAPSLVLVGSAHALVLGDASTEGHCHERIDPSESNLVELW